MTHDSGRPSALSRLTGPLRAALDRLSATPPPGATPAPPAAGLPASVRAMPLFSDLDDNEIALLGTFMTRWTVAAGTVVVRQGERTADLFLIETGQAEVRIRSDAGQSLTVATLGPGDYFGEIALVTGEPRTADVVAIAPLTVVRLSQEGYAALAHLAALEQLTATAHRRARATQEQRQRLDGAPSTAEGAASTREGAPTEEA